MKFKVGDKVKFLNDTGYGEITEIIDEKFVKVRTDEGFDIPVPGRELLIFGSEPDYESGTAMTKTYTEETEKPRSRKENLKQPDENELEIRKDLPYGSSTNLLIGFVPVAKKNLHLSDIAIFLINDSDYTVFYSLGFLENVSWMRFRYGFLEDNTKYRLHIFNQSDISKIKQMHIQVLFLSKGRYFPMEPVNRFIDIENTGFYKENTFKENEFFDEKALLFNLSGISAAEQMAKISDKEIAEVIAAKEPKNIQAKNKQEIREVDLHIHELVEESRNLTAGEILKIQMNTFHAELEKAIGNGIKKVVFIHGVGSGILKQEIIKTVKEKYPELVCQDASFKEYGYGATLIFIK